MPGVVTKTQAEHIEESKLLSQDEVCSILKVSRSALYRYMAQKKDPLPSFKFGGRRRFRHDQLMWWIDKHAVS